MQKEEELLQIKQQYRQRLIDEEKEEAERRRLQREKTERKHSLRAGIRLYHRIIFLRVYKDQFPAFDIMKIFKLISLVLFICDVLRNLVLSAQFKKRKKQPWTSFTSCNFTESNTLPWMFFTFFRFCR